MPDGDFEMMEPFGIDDGELGDASQQQCFVLGYELAQIHSLAERVTDRDAEKTVHAANIKRIETALENRGRQYSWMWPSDDKSESWVFLKIFAKEQH